MIEGDASQALNQQSGTEVKSEENAPINVKVCLPFTEFAVGD